MTKEFNLDDYQYVENVVTFNDWLRDYKPQPNTFNDEARFDGLLYEHQGDEWEHVVSQPVHNLWTMFQDEAGTFKIKNGLVVRGRVGYFVSEVQHNPHQTFMIADVDGGMLGGQDQGSTLSMNVYKYRIVPTAALKTYEEHGMTAEFDVETLNGELSITAPDEDTADKMRMTYTDIRMWERI
jgi:hypothetical protein